MRVKIEKLGRLGDGIAPGGVIVPLALPGEEVEGEIVEGRINVPRIVTPSPHRVRPACPRFRACGGCALQHASEDYVARWKRDLVIAALAARGVEADVRAPITSPTNSRRRATLSARRLKKGALVGFHGRASGQIVAPEGCTLLHPDLLAALPALHALTSAGASRKGEMKFTLTRTLGGVDVMARGGKEMGLSLRQELAAIAAEHGLARLQWGEEPVATLAPPLVQMGPARVPLPPGAFLQATEEGEKVLVSAVTESVCGASRVADLFAGCGTFALPLTAKCEVAAYEAEEAMLRAMQAGWRGAEGLKRLETHTRDLFRRPLLPDELARFDAVVIDPPRAGAQAQMQEIAKAHVPVVAAVSCNPESFARDARILLDAGYSMGPVTVVDQFRWAPHVELFARFSLT